MSALDEKEGRRLLMDIERPLPGEEPTSGPWSVAEQTRTFDEGGLSL